MRALLLAAALALALIPRADAKGVSKADFYQKLLLPEDVETPRGTIAKGRSCCDKSDCHQRVVTALGRGLFETTDDDGTIVTFTSRIEITDPDVLNDPARPFQSIVCIWEHVALCHLPGVSGG